LPKPGFCSAFKLWVNCAADRLALSSVTATRFFAASGRKKPAYWGYVLSTCLRPSLLLTYCKTCKKFGPLVPHGPFDIGGSMHSFTLPEVLPISTTCGSRF
jgi:hypothetical protein